MLLLTNGIARNSALSYEHVRDSSLSLSLPFPFSLSHSLTHSHSHCRGVLRDLSVVLSLLRSPVHRDSICFNLSRPLTLSIYLSRRRETLTAEPQWRFTIAEVVMTVLSRREFLARGGPSRPPAVERLVFVGHLVVADETEAFILRPCSNYSEI